MPGGPSSGSNLVECGPGCSRFEETDLLGPRGSADFDERLLGERGRLLVGEQVLGNAPDGQQLSQKRRRLAEPLCGFLLRQSVALQCSVQEGMSLQSP